MAAKKSTSKPKAAKKSTVKQRIKAAEKKAKSSGLIPGLRDLKFDDSKLDKAIKKAKK